MIKKISVILTMLLFTTFISAAQISEVSFVEPLNFKGVKLSDAVSVLSADAEVVISSDEKSSSKVLDLYFPAGSTLDTVLNTIATANGLKLVTISPKSFLFTSKDTSDGSSLSGIVKISGYELPVDNVKVTVLDSGLPPVYTTNGGKYVVKNLSPGTYIVRYEKDGFETEGEFITVTDKVASAVDVKLSKSGATVKTPAGAYAKGKSVSASERDLGNNILTERVTVTNVSSEEVKSVLEKVFGADLVVSSFPKLNMLILKGDQTIVRTAKNIAEDMDTQLKQVRIAAQTLEITDNLFEDLGFKWAFAEGSLQSPPEAPSGPGDEIPADPRTAVGSSGGDYGLLTDAVVGAGNATTLNMIRFFDDKTSFLAFSINMLQATTDATISAVPSILVINGEKGKFDMTQEELVSYNSVVTPSGNVGNLTTTEAVTGTAGIILEVTPIIKNDNYILLYINVEVSNFTGNASTITVQGGYNPKVTRKLASTVLINNGDTIFIGGMKTAASSSTISKIPYLGDIPYLGKLFTQTSKSNKIRDIYVKLKVDIVDSEGAKKEMDYSQFKNTELHKYPTTRDGELPNMDDKGKIFGL